ncbi:MAG: putative repeat protein (TIGR01451 family) [Candidatus Azotimanducaceae bacterium]|jgi:uncharacterized repeat protein (TIGR01451 family)
MATQCGHSKAIKFGETGSANELVIIGMVQRAANTQRKKRTPKILQLVREAMAMMIAMAFFMAAPVLSKAELRNGDPMTNRATLNYDGISASIPTSVDVQFRRVQGTSGPPTAINLACVSVEGCTGAVVVENTPGQILASLDVVDIDQVDGHVLSVVEDIRFEVVDGKLKLVDGEQIDFELDPTILIKLRAVDRDTNEFDLTVTVEVQNVNEEPFDLVISNNFVPAGQTGLPIGIVLVSDIDTVDEHTFEVIGDPRFIIVDGVLTLAPDASLDADTKILVTVLATDSGGLTTQTVIEVSTDPADQKTEQTPAVIEFLAQNPTGTQYNIEASACSAPDMFLPAPGSENFSRNDVSGAQKFAVADAYTIGDAVVVSVTDLDQNFRPLVKDTIRVLLTGNADEESILLTESEFDTGVFIGYIATTSELTANEDCILSVASRFSITVTYTDPTDQQDSVATGVFFSPFGIIFNDNTGETVDGIIVSLIDVATGLPAVVRGEGPVYAPFPSAVITGESLADSAGNLIEVGSGEYRFPSLAAGRYRLEVFSSRGWELSVKSDQELQALTPASSRGLVTTSEGRYILDAASRGVEFDLSRGSLPRIDIPLRRVPREIEPAIVTPSTILFLQYSANPNIGTAVDVGATTCVGGQNREVSEPRNIDVPVPGVVSLVPTTVFKAGQPIFIKVIDTDQNNNTSVREKIIVQLDVVASGDREFLELTETGVDTGEFIGYIQSTQDDSSTGSCSLGVVQNNPIRTTYIDAFDETDVSDSLVMVDPFGKLFSTKDGRLIDGVTVTLIDTATGAPAQVLGDGPFFADYPNPIVSGSQATDAGGLLYDFPTGEYRFPFVEAGFYRLEISNVPDGLTDPSVRSDEAIQSIPGAPYLVVAGSRGAEFEVPVGPALYIDIPLDEPVGEIFISKRANKEIAAIGDFVQYEISVQNNASSSVNNTNIRDMLPKGFRYQQGSLRIDGEAVAAPVISADGREMLIELPDVAAAVISIRYVVEITAGAEKGAAFNTATVVGDLVASTNVATARILVTDDLFRDKAILIGKVSLGQCKFDEDGEEILLEDSSHTTEGSLTGVAGVRLFLEDGSYVITDDDGMWHMEGIDAGAHIVQLDVDSLENRYEVSPCNENTRFAGSPYSQFVDVQGGTLWRADFEVRQKADPESIISLEQSIKVDDEGLWVSILAKNTGNVLLDKASAIYNIPKGWKMVSGTAMLNGAPVSASKSIVGSVFNLGTLTDEADLRFALEPKVQKKIESVASNDLEVFQPKFNTRSAELSESDRKSLDSIISKWKTRQLDAVTIVGHTDNVGIAAQNRQQYANNQVLSEARARSIAEYVRQRIVIPDLRVLGAGDQYPVASNETAGGRRQNRRVEFLLQERATSPQSQHVVNADVLNGHSAVRLSFRSAGTPRGKTAMNKLPLNRLVGGFDKLNATVEGKAIGSWDAMELLQDDLVARDPSVQGFINIHDGERLGRPVRAVKLDLDSKLKPKLFLDGVEIPSDRIGFSMVDDTSGKTLYSYIGVNFGEPGVHTLKLQGLDSFGNARLDETIDIVRVGDLFDIRVLETSGNIADGRTPVTVKLLLTDRDGEPLNISHTLTLESQELQRFDRDLNLTDLSEISDNDYVTVAADGTLIFNPVSHSGRFTARLIYDEFDREIEVFVEPEKRDWIMVGLAEGSVAYRTLNGNMEALRDADLDDEIATDGRIAFYAKGQVKGEYVLTLSYDTAKEDNTLSQVIDPNSFYTLYGDRTSTQFDAASREKLYLKLEKEQFYAVFGDFTTGLSTTELSSYSRSLTGLKSEYKGDKFEFNAFVSEVDQAFIKDEIRGDGTSGLYRLNSTGILVNSEKISIQTRDRFRSEEIVHTQDLTRHIDYNVDYDAGTIFFKAPVYSQDPAFNPVFIIIDYEIEGDGKDRLNAGGRFAYKPLENTEIGATLVKEGVVGRETDLVGLDLKIELGESTEIRAEVATTNSQFEDQDVSGTAYLAEIRHRGSDVEATGYIREQEGSFGVGQQNDSESGTRKVGVDAKYQVADNVQLIGEAFRQTGLSTGARQDVISSSARYQTDNLSLNSGLRSAKLVSNDEAQVSHQLLVGGTYRILDGKMGLSANADTPLGGKGDAANFPKRLRVGLDYKLTESITLKSEQEFTWGDQENTQGTRIGLSSKLWEGGELVTNIQQIDEENSQRLAAVAGLKQRWEMNDQWSFDFGIDRSQTIKSTRAPPALEVTTVFSSPNSDDFTAATFGSRFRKEAWDWTTRLEYRGADSADKLNIVSDVIHNLEEGKQLLAKIDYQKSIGEATTAAITGIQLGYSFRPIDSRWSLLNRLDLSRSSSQGQGFDVKSQKVVNNLNANYLLGEDTQVAFQYGLKYIVDNFDNDKYSGFTDLYGVELRHDVNSKWDVGFQSSFYNSWNSGVSDQSYGVSVGYNMARNVWMSLGYNFDGFSDDDFSASEYTAEGVFLKYRLKFDQYSARSLFDD